MANDKNTTSTRAEITQSVVGHVPTQSNIVPLSRNQIVASANPTSSITTKQFSPHTHLLAVEHDFLSMFLRKHERTECPALYVIWSAISAAGALLGKRCYFELGTHKIYANQYICFVGSPGSRKSTGISFSRALATLGDARMKFAPTDTSGRKQGLMSGFIPAKKKKENSANAARSADAQQKLEALSAELLKASGMPAANNSSLDAKSGDDIISEAEESAARVNELYACASELGSLTGIAQLETFIFFSELWDAPDVYKYSLRDTTTIIYNPMLSLIAGATPETLQTLMPAEAVGQGVMSRFIFVHGSPERKVPRPISWSEDFKVEVQNTMLGVRALHGEFGETMEAANALDRVYENYAPIVTDIRLMGYVERRHTHLIKMCMCLAALRGSMTITLDDVIDSNYILEMTEYYMPEAIGQTGSAKASIAGNLITYALAASPTGMMQNELYTLLRGNYNYEDVSNAIRHLADNGYITAKMVQNTTTKTHDTLYVLDRTRCTVRSRNEIVELLINK